MKVEGIMDARFFLDGGPVVGLAWRLENVLKELLSYRLARESLTLEKLK